MPRKPPRRRSPRRTARRTGSPVVPALLIAGVLAVAAGVVLLGGGEVASESGSGGGVVASGSAKPKLALKPAPSGWKYIACRDCAASGRVDTRDEAIANQARRLLKEKRWDEFYEPALRDALESSETNPKWLGAIREAIRTRSLSPLPSKARSSFRLAVGMMDATAPELRRVEIIRFEDELRAGKRPLPDAAWNCRKCQGSKRELVLDIK